MLPVRNPAIPKFQESILMGNATVRNPAAPKFQTYLYTPSADLEHGA